MANILIVDDDPGILEALGRIIKLEEHTAFEAAGGDDALDVLRAHHIDLAFVDLRMPEMNGIELMRRVREAYPETTLVPMSAVRELLIAPSEFTDAATLTKPFTVEEVQAVLR